MRVSRGKYTVRGCSRYVPIEPLTFLYPEKKKPVNTLCSGLAG